MNNNFPMLSLKIIYRVEFLSCYLGALWILLKTMWGFGVKKVENPWSIVSTDIPHGCIYNYEISIHIIQSKFSYNVNRTSQNCNSSQNKIETAPWDILLHQTTKNGEDRLSVLTWASGVSCFSLSCKDTLQYDCRAR